MVGGPFEQELSRKTFLAKLAKRSGDESEQRRIFANWNRFEIATGSTLAGLPFAFASLAAGVMILGQRISNGGDRNSRYWFGYRCFDDRGFFCDSLGLGIGAGLGPLLGPLLTLRVLGCRGRFRIGFLLRKTFPFA
jgi:hypothetical protein